MALHKDDMLSQSGRSTDINIYGYYNIDHPCKLCKNMPHSLSMASHDTKHVNAAKSLYCLLLLYLKYNQNSIMYFDILNISVEAVSYIKVIEIRNIHFISLNWGKM